MKRRLAITAMALALSAAPAFGQGCAMCYESAKGASTKGQDALSHAVAVLLFPTLTLMIGVVGFAFIYSNKRDRENPEPVVE